MLFQDKFTSLGLKYCLNYGSCTIKKIKNKAVMYSIIILKYIQIQTQKTMEQDSKKEAERLRKATYRAKLKSKSDGSYLQTPIELAKELLEAMKEPDANAPF